MSGLGKKFRFPYPQGVWLLSISGSMLLLKSKKLKHHKGLQWQLPPPRAHAWVSQDSFEGDPVQKPLKSPNMFRVAAFILLRKCFKNVDLIPAHMSIHVCIDAHTCEHGGQRARSEAITHALLVFKMVSHWSEASQLR